MPLVRDTTLHRGDSCATKPIRWQEICFFLYLAAAKFAPRSLATQSGSGSDPDINTARGLTSGHVTPPPFAHTSINKRGDTLVSIYAARKT